MIHWHKDNGQRYDIQYAPMTIEQRNAVNLLEPKLDKIWFGKFIEGDPLKWPGRWHQKMDDNVYSPKITETLGNYTIHNTMREEAAQLNQNLSKDKEQQLLLQAADGDQAARNKVIEAYISLAYKIAKTQQKKFKRVELNEMTATAYLTLCEQVDGIITKIKDGDFNHKRIYTVIHNPIIFAIKRIGQDGVIKVSKMKMQDRLDLTKTAKELFEELLSKPTKEQILETLGWGELRYNNLMSAFSAQNVKRMDPADLEILEVYDHNIGETRRFNLEELTEFALTNILTFREAEIISMRFGLGADQINSVNAVAEILNISKPTVKRDTALALKKLKEFYLELGVKI